MAGSIQRTGLHAIAIVAASAAIAIVTNLLRADGIPLVTDIPYEIFAPCKDSEVESEQVRPDELSKTGEQTILYVDARPPEIYEKEHVQGAINVPYSALFGADQKDIDRVIEAVKQKKPTSVIVYGAYADPSSPETKVDFGKPLAQQLVEATISGVRHVEGGLDALNKAGIATVKANGDSQ
ncbi:MAG: rhodanese-like domain-containing protein [Myxococcota bacterium]|nr:rhodanese-like domain-containing protein [Myxococcota bacterium]